MCMLPIKTLLYAWVQDVILVPCSRLRDASVTGKTRHRLCTFTFAPTLVIVLYGCFTCTYMYLRYVHSRVLTLRLLHVLSYVYLRYVCYKCLLTCVYLHYVCYMYFTITVFYCSYMNLPAWSGGADGWAARGTSSWATWPAT